MDVPNQCLEFAASLHLCTEVQHGCAKPVLGVCRFPTPVHRSAAWMCQTSAWSLPLPYTCAQKCSMDVPNQCLEFAASLHLCTEVQHGCAKPVLGVCRFPTPVHRSAAWMCQTSAWSLPLPYTCAQKCSMDVPNQCLEFAASLHLCTEVQHGCAKPVLGVCRFPTPVHRSAAWMCQTSAWSLPLPYTCAQKCSMDVHTPAAALWENKMSIMTMPVASDCDLLESVISFPRSGTAEGWRV